MRTTQYVYWQDAEMWLGFLEEYPDYRTQGETKEELDENLREIQPNSPAEISLVSERLPNLTWHETNELGE